MNSEDQIPEDIKSQLCMVCKSRCCTKLGIPTLFKSDNLEAAQFFQVRGYAPIDRNGTLWLYQENNPCPMLSKSDGKTCTIYDNRPKACRDYSCLNDLDLLGSTAWSEYLDDRIAK